MDFQAARRLVPLLHGIGITHIYASPIFQARHGSTHGYDVIDPLRLDPVLGSESDFESFSSDLKAHGMGLILDVVPNHMAASAENRWWEDVLEQGPGSEYSRYFDIDWHGTQAGWRGRLVLPVLGGPYRQVLESGQLHLALDADGFHVRYWEHRFPLRLESYSNVLSFCNSSWRREPGTRIAAVRAFERLMAAAGRVSASCARPRRLFKSILKKQLWDAYESEPGFRDLIDRNLPVLSVDQLLAAQHYALAEWRIARDHVNYRRFFDINELAALRAEDAEVFHATHALLLRLVREGRVDGVRVDHVDGLYDPGAYLARLDEALRAARNGAEPYVLAEKVLLGEETLRASWPVRGTTGYDFLNAANGLFVDGGNLVRLEEIYAAFTGAEPASEAPAYVHKNHVMRELFAGELRRLSEQAAALAGWSLRAEDLSEAIVEVTARLPVYRTYIRSWHVPQADRKALRAALDAAPPRPALDFLRRVLLLQLPGDASCDERAAWLEFVMRWQQFTGPVMAKGVEDTACYVHNSLVSLNTVGGCRRPVSVSEFHAFNAARREAWPHSMNASSTHDTKRSEDVAARIHVLSELPGLWAECLSRWSAWNARHKVVLESGPAPSANDEILLYQAMLGAWPLSNREVPDFRRRLRQFAMKAAREAKSRTSWLEPDASYEAALTRFVDCILDDAVFLEDFLDLEEKIAPFGALNSLAQLVLKTASPGVPDFYQGTLLWDFSLVDPDNRRPVDFERQVSLFETLDGRPPDFRELVDNWKDGHLKLYTIMKALEFRRWHEALFRCGEYLPVDVRGPAANHIVAFARRNGSLWAVVAVPRLLAGLCEAASPLAPPEVWAGTSLHLPTDAPRHWRQAFTGQRCRGPVIAAATLFRDLPVAVLGQC